MAACSWLPDSSKRLAASFPVVYRWSTGKWGDLAPCLCLGTCCGSKSFVQLDNAPGIYTDEHHLFLEVRRESSHDGFFVASAAVLAVLMLSPSL